jgi:hypothetical protein
MDILLKDTGLFYAYMENVINILRENNIRTVSDLLSFNVDALVTRDFKTKNQLRGLKDLLLFRYKGELLPSEVYLSTSIDIKEDIDRNLVVNTNGVNFHRLGFSENEVETILSWAQIMYVQYATKSIDVIDLFESYINYNGRNGSALSLKLKMYLDYYYNYKYQLAVDVNTIDDLVNLRGRMLYLKKRKESIIDTRIKFTNHGKRGIR